MRNTKILKVTLFKNSLKFATPCMLFYIEKVEEEDVATVARTRL